MPDQPTDRSAFDRSVAAIARRDLASLKREKTIVLALLIQLFIAAFSSFLVVGLTSLYDPSAVDGGGVDIGVSGEYTEHLLTAAAGQEGIDAKAFDDAETAVAAFHRGDVHAVVDTSPRETGTGTVIEATAIAPDDSLRSTLVVVQIRTLLSELEAQQRAARSAYLDVEPVDAPDPLDASPYFGFTYTVLIPLLVFLPPFISGSIAVDSITEEIERGTLELLRVTPLSLTDVVTGKAAGMILLAPAQVVLWIVLLSANGISVHNPLAVLAFVSAVATLLVALGLGLGLLTRQRRRAQLLYSVIALGLFVLAAGLPEHPATTVAKLAVASGTTVTGGHVIGAVVLAVLAAPVGRRLVRRVDPESLS